MQKRKTPEGIIKQQICEYLKLKHITFWVQESQGTFDPITKVFRKKNSPFQMNGVSDLIVLLNEQGCPYVLFLEVKAYTKLSENQNAFKRLLEANGHYYAVAKSIEDAEMAVMLCRQDMLTKIQLGAIRIQNLLKEKSSK